VASYDWVKKDYIIKEFACPLILATTNIVYPDEFKVALREKSFYVVPM
jgi:hypothetical protein